MTISPGTKLGPYDVLASIGKGGMGEVFRARDTRLGRDVAIKVLPESFARDPDRLQRFEQEARSVAALNHPNLLTVFDVGTMPAPDGGTIPYLVSELLEGATLRELLDKGALPLRKVLDYSAQVARGLAAAHDHGVVHRDIKPDNLFLTRDGRVKILDFGLAKLKPQEVVGDETVAHNLTHADAVLGTVGYMSPEQLRGKPVDARSDLFSLGAVMYEMLSGRRAFQGDSSADVMSAILNKEPPELPENTAEFSPALDHMVRRCLEKDPQQRFQSAGDLAFQLQELSGNRTTSSASGVMPKPQAIATRRNWLLPVACTAAIVFAALAAWSWVRPHGHRAPPTFTAITFQQGFVTSARFLHDGQTVVSVARWGSEPETGLHTGTVDTVTLRSLDTPADFIASDSVNDDILLLRGMKSVGPGYVAVGTLLEMHYGGGAPRALMDSIEYADWDPEGKKFAVVHFVPESHLYRLEYPVGTVLYQTEGWISHPRFSRDGKSIAFLDHSIFGDDQGNVATVDLQGHVKKWKGNFGTAQGLAWSPDGTEIWFSASNNSTNRSLWAASLDGKERQLLSAPGTLDIEDALPNGRVLVDHLSERRVLMVSTSQFPEPRDFTWMDWAYGMRFSADGKQILFGDQDSGPLYGTFLRNLDGSPAVRLGDGDPMDISPDGNLVISRLPVAPDQIELLPTGTGEPRQLTHSKMNFQSARWLTNAEIVANANEAGHPVRSFLVDLQGNIKPLTAEGVRALVLTPDGKQMLVTGPGANSFRLMAVDGGGASEPVAGLLPDDIPLDFKSNASALYVGRRISATKVEIWQIDRPSGKRTLLHAIAAPGIPAITNGLAASVSRDGKSYAFEYHPAMSTEYLVDGLH
jgi:hypothetical protein